MSDNGNQKTFVNQYRRKTLLSGAAFLAVNFVASPSLACSGGDGGDGGEQSEQSSTTKKKPIVKMSVDEFRSLSPGEIDRHIRGGTVDRKYDIKVRGFSTKMSENLMMMANWDRASTRKLLKDMSKLETKEARKARLKKEDERAKKLKKLHKDSEKKLKKNKASQEAQNEEHQRFRKAKFYKTNLWRWLNDPSEGTYK